MRPALFKCVRPCYSSNPSALQTVLPVLVRLPRHLVLCYFLASCSPPAAVSILHPPFLSALLLLGGSRWLRGNADARRLGGKSLSRSSQAGGVDTRLTDGASGRSCCRRCADRRALGWGRGYRRGGGAPCMMASRAAWGTSGSGTAVGPRGNAGRFSGSRVAGAVLGRNRSLDMDRPKLLVHLAPHLPHCASSIVECLRTYLLWGGF